MSIWWTKSLELLARQCSPLKSIVVDEGVLQCKKCKSRRVLTITQQTRSADEGSTAFAFCSECSHTWKES
jgi:DNA-directed RNA polymerase subunit M/transcription elongation factor TFIIS